MIHNSIVITTYQDKLLAVYQKDSCLTKIEAYPLQNNILGNIYKARISNVNTNILAAFADIEKGKSVYISYPDAASIPKQGTELPVKIIKDAIKTKAPVASPSLSIDGTYSVITCDRPGSISYSKKLSPSVREQIEEYLKENLNQFNHSEFGIIIRTDVNLLKQYEPLKQELQKNCLILSDLIKNAPARSCYSVLYQNTPGYMRFIHEIAVDSYDKIVTDIPSVYETLMQSTNPHIKKECISLYEDSYSLVLLYSLQSKISEILSKKVWLSSGGSLFIEATEALTVVDVNTGKCIQKQEKNKLISQINHEAVTEICRQIILRNISGIIIIDFINMEKEAEKTALIHYLKQKLKEDPVKTNFIDITPLGLVEITRMKIRPSFYEQLAATAKSQTEE